MKKSTPWLLMLLLTGIFCVVYYEQREEIIQMKKELVEGERRSVHNYQEFSRQLDEVISAAGKYQRALENCRRGKKF